MRAQPTHSNLAAYVLHAVQSEVCTTGLLANFNQTFEAVIALTTTIHMRLEPTIAEDFL
jgi:hypothetical protein